jgi:RNA polymerase sigma-B factor
MTEANLRQETLELLHRYRESGDRRLRDRLVKLNLGLVRREAHHWQQRCSENFEDLVQVGCLGLMQAIERFDLSKGHAFSSFAIPCIRGEIRHYLRDRSSPLRMPRRWAELQQQSEGINRELEQRLHRLPSPTETASALGISEEEWQQIRLAQRNRHPLSLDLPVRDEADHAISLGELIPDPQGQWRQLAQEDRLRLTQAMEQLEERTRQVLEAVFLEDLHQKDVAERLGVSVVTVSRQVRKGIRALQRLLGNDG